MDADGFAERLDELEDRRQRAEGRLAGSLRRAHELVEELASRAEVADAHRRRMREALPGEPDDGHDRPAAAEAEHGEVLSDPQVVEVESDESARPGGLGDRLGEWVIRPWHEYLRRRRRDRLRELAELREEVDRQREHGAVAMARLRRRQATLQRRLHDHLRERADSFSWIVASSQLAVEALAAAMGVHEALVGLADARGAETVHRVTRPVDRRLEAAFLDLGRRQEGLLAELVGLRRRLDDLAGVWAQLYASEE